MNEYELIVKSPSGKCLSCSKNFSDGEIYKTYLYWCKGNGYKREDFCLNCTSLSKDNNRLLVCCWKGRFRKEKEKTNDNDSGKVEMLFRSLVKEQPNRILCIFLLAVMLERKRILVEHEVRIETDKKIRVYEHKKTGEVFLIYEPYLSLEDMKAGYKEISDLLQMENK